MSRQSDTQGGAHVRKALARISLREPARAAALTLLEGKLVPEGDLPALFREVRDPRARRWRECLVAAWALGRVDLDLHRQRRLTPSLCAIIEGKRPNDLLDNAVSWSVKLGCIGGALVGITAATVYVLERFEPFDIVGRAMLGAFSGIVAGAFSSVMLTLVVAPFIFPMSWALDRRRMIAARVETARLLGLWSQPRAIGALATAARSSPEPLRTAARDALDLTLAALTEDSSGQLCARDQTALCALISPNDERFSLRVLDALAKAGGGAALPDVRRLAVHCTSAAIRAAACALIPVLEERASEERQRKTLLRPSAAGPPKAAPLLRPAAASQTAQALLLRSAALQSDGES